MISSSRRRSINEEEPLVLELTRNYWTFQHKQRRHPYYSLPSTPRYYSWWMFLLLTGGAILLWRRHHHHHHQRHTGAYHNNIQFFHELAPEHPERNNMIWDYNAYHSAAKKTESLLLAQQDDAEGMADITSLPNRAYARQRGLDYVRYRRLDVSVLLQYDTVVFFPPNAVIIHLDHSLHELLPTKDQFMTVGNMTGFFVLNLRHPYTTRAIISQWQTLLEDDVLLSPQSLLLLIVPPQLISYLPEQDGFVGNRIIQCIHETSEDTQRTLSSTVASVCYRYYPKCEVL